MTGFLGCAYVITILPSFASTVNLCFLVTVYFMVERFLQFSDENDQSASDPCSNSVSCEKGSDLRRSGWPCHRRWAGPVGQWGAGARREMYCLDWWAWAALQAMAGSVLQRLLYKKGSKRPKIAWNETQLFKSLKINDFVDHFLKTSKSFLVN